MTNYLFLMFGDDSSPHSILAVCLRIIARVFSLDLFINICKMIVNVSYFPQLRGKEYKVNCLSAPSLSIPSTSSSGGLDLNASTIDSLSSMSAGYSEVLSTSTFGEDAIDIFDWNSFSVGL